MIPGKENLLPDAQWRDATLRQVVLVSLPGKRLRVRISNAYGVTPLLVHAASVALAVTPGQSEVIPQTMRALSFGGKNTVSVPAGAEVASDAVTLEHGANAALAISMHFVQAPSPQTGHPGSRSTSFIAAGDRVLDTSMSGAERVTRWYQLTGVEVLAAPGVRSIVAIGDSITDGYGVNTDTNTRWTDFLAARLRASGMNTIGVINAGIGGGRMLRDGLGPSLISRFERDVLARYGISHAIVMIGVNDLGGLHRSGQETPAARQQLLEDMRKGFSKLVAQAHAKGVCVIGGTITPYGGSGYYRPNAENELDRQAINRWIRESKVFDGVADFDAALRDPARPDRLDKAYDNDGLHPSVAGYKAMAQAVPLNAVASCKKSPVGMR